MVSLIALWLPILLSAVIVFIASSIIHMLLPYHRSDYKQLPEEDKLLPVLRAAGLQLRADGRLLLRSTEHDRRPADRDLLHATGVLA